MKKIKLNNQKKIGIIIVLFMIGFVLLGFLNRNSFELMNKDLILKGPSFSHLFGCDEFGRDILKRTQYGMGISVAISFFAVLTGTFFCTVIGALCGYYSGVVDEVNATEPVAVGQLSLAFDVVLTAHKVPHEIAPIHPVALVVDEELEVLSEGGFADVDRLAAVVGHAHVIAYDVAFFVLAVTVVHVRM